MRTKIDYEKSGLIAAGVISAIAITVYRNELNITQLNLSNLVATIFSVLAGFLTVALNLVVTVRPEAFRSRASRRRYNVEMSRRIKRYNYLFYSYIAVLLCVFYSELFAVGAPRVGRWFEIGYTAMGSAALIWSLSIPGLILRLHNESGMLLARIAENREKAAARAEGQ